MALVFTIDALVVSILVWMVLTRGLERALPFFAFIVVLVPWQSKIALPGLFDLNTQRVALITLIGLYVLTRMWKPRSPSPRRVPIIGLILLSLGWLVLSTAHSVVPAASLKTLLAEAVEYYLMYVILVRTISSTKTIHRILFGVVAALMVCSVLGVGEAQFGWRVTDWFPQQASRFVGGGSSVSERGFRIATTFAHPIHYGAALAIAIPLAFYLISVTKSRFLRGLLWAAMPLMFYNILKTGSRGPWLALGLSLIGVFLLCRGRLRWYLPAIAFMGLFMLMARSSMRERLIGFFSATLNSNTTLGASFDYRFALINVAEHALAANTDRAVLGYGPGSFNSLGLRGPFQGDPEFLFWSCDSTWVKFAVETGYIGLIIMAMLLLTPALMALRDYLRFRKPEATLSGVLLISLVAYYFMMLSVAMYSWSQIGFLLWILITLSVAYGRLVRRSQYELAFQPVPDSASELVLVANGQAAGYAATTNFTQREHRAMEIEEGGHTYLPGTEGL